MMRTLLSLVAGALIASSALAGGYVGDYAPGDTIDCNFGTVQPSTGASFSLAGTPAISVYKDNGTTESTSGVTLTAGFDSRTGLNHVRVTTASDGTFYSAGGYFEAVITAGTVDSVSVVGQPVCAFTLGKVSALRPTVAARTLDVTSGGNAGIDLDNVTVTNGAPTAGFSASGTLSGTHTSTTADLGTNAPGSTNDIVGHTLTIPAKHFSRTITAYNSGTGVATFDATSLTLANGDAWYLWETAPGSGGSGLDAAGVRAAVGLSSANLDSQFATLATSSALSTAASNVSAIKTKTDFLPSATAGSAGGVFIAGTNAATAITSGLTANITGNVSGSVGSVTGNVGGNVTGSVGSVTGNVGGTVNGLTSTAQGNVRTALGLSSANLDTQLSGLSTGISGLSSAIAVIDGIVDQLLIGVNVEQMNGHDVCGSGTSGDKWTGCP